MTAWPPARGRDARRRPCHRNLDPVAARCAHLERLPYPRRACARHHLDSRRARSDARRRAFRGAEGKSDAALLQFRCRPRQQRAISPARCWARSASAGSPTGSAARSCSSSRSRSISPRRPRPRCHGASASYALFRFLTGAGIGGEYTAINSTIQELVPARYRGWTDLVINGSFWIGAALGAVSAIVLLDPAVDRPRSRLAARLFHRRGARPDRAGHADVDSRKPALADDPRPSRRRRTRSSTTSSAR